MRSARALLEDSKAPVHPTCLSVGILCAFAIEAYLNHVGAMKVRTWESVERLGPKEKLELLEELCSFSIDREGPIYGTFTAVLAFRNTVAHGRNDVWLEVGDPLELMETGMKGSRPRAHWELRASPTEVRKWLDNAEEMMRLIQKAAGLADATAWSADPLAITYQAAYRIAPLPPGLKVRNGKT